MKFVNLQKRWKEVRITPTDFEKEGTHKDLDVVMHRWMPPTSAECGECRMRHARNWVWSVWGVSHTHILCYWSCARLCLTEFAFVELHAKPWCGFPLSTGNKTCIWPFAHIDWKWVGGTYPPTVILHMTPCPKSSTLRMQIQNRKPKLPTLCVTW